MNSIGASSTAAPIQSAGRNKDVLLKMPASLVVNCRKTSCRAAWLERLPDTVRQPQPLSPYHRVGGSAKLKEPLVSDTQLLALALSIVIPIALSASAVIYSNSRITDTKETLRAEMRALHAELLAEIRDLKSLLKIHELEHHK